MAVLSDGLHLIMQQTKGIFRREGPANQPFALN